MPTICMYEIFKVVQRQRGEDASKLSGEYRLPMADAVIYATCLRYRAVLWTQDSHFATLDHVQFIEKR